MKKEAITKFYLTYRLYIFPGVVALSSLILIVFVIFPQTAKLLGNQKTQGDLFNKSKLLEVKAQELETFDEEDLSRKVGVALNLYPPDQDFGNVIGLLQAITNQVGFSILTLNLGGNTAKGKGQSYSLKVEVAGPKSLLPLLLSNIENSNRLLRVSSVDIASKDGQTADVNLGIEALYAAVPNTVGSLDSPLPKLSQKEEELITKLVTSAPALISKETPEGPQSPTFPKGKANPFE